MNCRNCDVYRLGQRKEYAHEAIGDGSTIGIMLDMERGELSFIIDGKNCGVASRDRRLKEGKYYAAILLMSAEDKITLLSPRKFQMA